MNQGPPINVASGSYVNLDKVIDHYKKINEETEQRRQEIEKYYQENEKPITSVSKKKLQVS
jgi:cell shape-determining protein MreC